MRESVCRQFSIPIKPTAGFNLYTSNDGGSPSSFLGIMPCIRHIYRR